ncbi:MAG TPA: threonine--tRNA ligase [Planctomycetota bacterium]|nr:threonine--tRNA ligase [Planctomycetota bacterium]
MAHYILPDGKKLEFAQAATGRQIAEAIGPGLARKALAIKVAGTIRDLDATVADGATVTIITGSNDNPDALHVLRHSCAHILAEAVCELLPGTRLAYGPAIEDGFFYDMATPRPLTDADFAAIEAKMAQIVKEDRPFTRRDYSCAEGLARTAEDKYKHDNAQRAIAKGAESISFYSTGVPGQHWEDLCAGPHVPRTGVLGAFKVMAVAGAYWHGDQASDQLTRVYGTCFADAKGLKEHLHRIEEAKRRDHRKLGKEMDLFHLEEDNPGQVFWHAKGWAIYRTLEDYIRARIRAVGYVEVKTPSVMAKSLWERSGHWAKYRDNMFVTASEEREFAIKPMNCPGHIEIFKQGLKSYRELPLRMAEFGACCRNELSGALHGIMRVRGFVQDDAHIFCTEQQVPGEVAAFCALLKSVYADFGFGDQSIGVKLSTRPALRVGSDEQWDRAEAGLMDACRQAGLAYEIAPGEGAFYGPKLEFRIRDSLKREWQCGTIQLDSQLPSAERLGAEYVGEDGQKHHPVMLHRAILGSMERFIGILIEHFAGKFPLWLSPEQIRVLPIADAHLPYARETTGRLFAAGLRATIDEKPDKLGAKIRQARLDRASYFAVVGDQEAANGTLALQNQAGEKIGVFPVAEVIARLEAEIAEKRLPPAEAAAAAAS